jgi:hypothetical protein
MFSIKAGSGQSQPFHRAAMHKVLVDNLIYIFKPDKAIPDSLGIDHNRWTVLALVEAAGLVGADKVLQSSLLDGILEGGFELLTAFGKAAWPRRGFVAFVGADKDVMLKFRHWAGFPSSVSFAFHVREAGLSETIWDRCNLTILSRLKTT